MATIKIRHYIATVIIYLVLVASVFGFNVIRARTTPPPTQPAAAAATPTPTVSSAKPYFSLTTNRSIRW